jgi:hypothetical protein
MVYGAASVASACVPILVTLSTVLSMNAENSPVTSPPLRERSPPCSGNAVAEMNDAVDFECRSDPVMLPTAVCVGVQSKRASMLPLSVCRRSGMPVAVTGIPRACAAVMSAATESRETPSPASVAGSPVRSDERSL